MPAQFNIDSRHNEDARFKKVLFGYDGEVLEVEVNELQDIFNTRMARLVNEVFGSRPLYAGTYAISSGTLTISNEVAVINKELLVLPTASIAVANGDTIYLNLIEKTVTSADVIKQYGNTGGTATVTNYLQDSRITEETTRRVQVTYQLTKSNVGTGTFLKLCSINASVAVVQSTADYADSDLYKEVRRLAREVVNEANGIASQLAAHIGSGGSAHANAVAGGAAGFMTGADKAKLDGVATGAEVNQNTFSIISANGTNVSATSKTDTATLTPSGAITITAAGKTITIGLPNATQSAAGAMSSTDKAKLDGIATGAEVNQNTFSVISANGTTVSATAKTDTVTLTPSGAVTITATGKTVTIGLPNATQSAAGAMSAADKAKLDGIATGASGAQNEFLNVKVGATTITASSTTDTLTLTAGTAVTLTGDATGKTVTIAVPNATTSADGSMSSADKTKLNGVATGAEVNQNAFATVTAGGTNLAAASKSDTLTLAAGTGITITGSGKTATIAVDSTIETTTGSQAKANAVQTNLTNHIGTGGSAHANVVAGGAAGFMTGADKTKLDGIATGAEVNQNAFATVTAGGQTLAADAKSDTLAISAGTGITITGDASTDTVTITAQSASTAQVGVVQLNDTITSTSTTLAATANAAKKAYDSAVAWAKGWGLGDVASDWSNKDLNALDVTGFYRGSGMTNRFTFPGGNSNWQYVIHIKHDSTYQVQIAIDYDTGQVASRAAKAGAWQAWRRHWDDTNLPWSGMVYDKGSLSSAADWNWLDSGIYQVFDGGSSSTSFPPNAYRYGTLVVTRSGNTVTQVYYAHSTGFMYVRTSWASVGSINFTAWQWVFTQGGNVYTDRVVGSSNNEIIYFGSGNASPMRMDMSGASSRIGRDDSNYIRFDSDSSINFVLGGVSRHIFYGNGTKSGGSIEISGVNLGMSPIDSPQILIEYIAFNIPLSPTGTKVQLREYFRSAVEDFDLFPNNGKVVEKGNDYFIIEGEGTASVRVVGERIGYKDHFWTVIEPSVENV